MTPVLMLYIISIRIIESVLQEDVSSAAKILGVATFLGNPVRCFQRSTQRETAMRTSATTSALKEKSMIHYNDVVSMLTRDSTVWLTAVGAVSTISLTSLLQST